MTRPGPNTAGRQPALAAQTLDRGWSLCPDPDNRGRAEGWSAKPQPDAAAAPVPGLIQEVFPEYRGIAWYWCTFRLDRRLVADERCLLRLGSVDYLAEVWVNGMRVGGHEGREVPFVLDVTDAARADSANLLAIRVHGLTEQPIDGLKLEGSPRGCNPYQTGGIHRPVEVLVTPAVRTVDVFARPSISAASIGLMVTVRNDLAAPAGGRLVARALDARTGDTVSQTAHAIDAPPGPSEWQMTLSVPSPRLWGLDDPYLYQVTVDLLAATAGGRQLEHACAVRCGFRDFRVVDGYFRLNGKRVFVRSLHTVPFYPIGGAVPRDPGLVRRDLVLAKAAGFNMVRFIVSTALPEQLDCADEIGLMVYEESPASWLMEDSPRMEEHFDRSLREAVVRDRNHPCVTVWGLLNETIDRRRYRHAAASLPLVRRLDDTRLVLFQSGRHDGNLGIGSLCNPGSTQWEYQWGAETPGSADVAKDAGGEGLLGYYPGMGDFHVYPPAPQSEATDRFLRTVGHDSRPVFLSEYGIGSQFDAIGSWRALEQAKAPEGLPDLTRYRSIAQAFTADWKRFGMDGVYPFPQDMLVETQRRHARQRLLGFDLIRANPRICGFSLTSMLDVTSGEGLWDLFRQPKAGVLDAMRDGWAPLRWCLFATPMHAYAGRPVRLEAVLANEDVLPAGDYPVWLRVCGPDGVAWERRLSARVPGVGDGRDVPLATPVLDEQVVLAGPPGLYEFAASMERDGNPAGGRLRFHLSDTQALPQVTGHAEAWGIDARVEAWLRRRGLGLRPVGEIGAVPPGVVLVGTPTAPAEADWAALRQRVREGSVAVFLDVEVFAHADQPLDRWPLEPRGVRYQPYESLYHRDCVAKRHPLFAGLQGPGVLDWDYYGQVLPRYHLDGQGAPDELVAAGFATCQPSASGYEAGMLMGAYRMGAGWFVFNTFQVLGNVEAHPAADRLLVNLVRDAFARLA